jgi:hypothetical protein
MPRGLDQKNFVAEIKGRTLCQGSRLKGDQVGRFRLPVGPTGDFGQILDEDGGRPSVVLGDDGVDVLLRFEGAAAIGSG